jgi:hypothetical protein
VRVCVCVHACLRAEKSQFVSKCPLESPSLRGVTSSSQIPPLVEEEASFQNMYMSRKKK